MMQPGEGLFSAMPVAGNAEHPEIEARVLDSDGSLIATVELPSRESSTGITGSGLRIAGTDRAGFLSFEALLGGDNHRLTWHTGPLGGIPPRDVLPAAEFMAVLRPGRRVQLALRDGLSLTGSGWPLEDAQPNFELIVELCRALIEIQGHTSTRVVFPATVSAWVDDVLTALRIIRGEAVERTWHGIDVVADPNTSSPELLDGEFQLLRDEVLTLTIGDQQIETDVRTQFHALSARIVEVAPLPDRGQGAVHARFVPGTNNTGVLRALTSAQAADWERGRFQVAQIAPS